MDQRSIGFLIYVRFDDEQEDRRLAEFCKRLTDEVRNQSGQHFDLLQDRNHIAWGQQWQHRVEEPFDAVTFFFLILTPGFFKSPSCHAECERALELEVSLGRDDLILPIYYVNYPAFNDEAQRQADPMLARIAGRDGVDWRDLRLEPFTSPQLSKRLAQLAGRVVNAMGRSQPARMPAPDSGAAGAPQPAGSAPPAQQPASRASFEPARAQTNKIDPPIRVVDPHHSADHLTLIEALTAAQPGDRILVRPGLYLEGLVIDKPVEILGDGDPGEVVIEANGKSAVLFQASMGRLSNLTLRQVGGGDWFCVDIVQGRLDLEDCDLTSRSLACVAIHDGADPRLRRNRIHDGKGAGVYVYNNGLGTLEDNNIFANANAGVQIKTNGNPTLRNNRIHAGRETGVYVYDNGQGVLVDNEIFANAFAGVAIKTGGNPILRRNRIHDGKASGVFIYEDGAGILEENEIFANANAGVWIRTGGHPILRRNRIFRNSYAAIYVNQGGGGEFEENDLRDNPRGAWKIDPDSIGRVKRIRNRDK